MASTISPPALASLLGDGWRRPGESSVALADALRALVVNGRVAVRTRIPSERALGEQLAISRGSVSRAYDRLREDGYLASRRGAGSWLTLPDGSGPAPPSPLGNTASVDLTKAALPAPDPLLAECAVRATGQLSRHLHADGYLPAGLPELREAVAARLTARGLDSCAEEVLITSGAQHALHLILQLLAAPGDRIVVDSPSYPRALSAIRAARARAIPVPLTATGWDPDNWSAALGAVGPRLALTVPDFHNPTGHVMSAEARAAIAHAAARQGTLLICDETTAELHLDGPAPPRPLGCFDPGTTVITIGTMSKSAWGGLRVGWIRAPRRLIAELMHVRADVDMAGPVLDQLLACELLQRWDEVLADRRAVLKQRRDALIGALPDGWRSRRPRGGLSLWAQLPAPVSTQLAARAQREDIAITPGPAFGADGSFEGHVRLPFTQPPDVLLPAVARLAELAGGLQEGQPASALAPALSAV